LGDPKKKKRKFSCTLTYGEGGPRREEYKGNVGKVLRGGKRGENRQNAKEKKATYNTIGSWGLGVLGSCPVREEGGGVGNEERWCCLPNVLCVHN